MEEATRNDQFRVLDLVPHSFHIYCTLYSIPHAVNSMKEEMLHRAMDGNPSPLIDIIFHVNCAGYQESGPPIGLSHSSESNIPYIFSPKRSTV